MGSADGDGGDRRMIEVASEEEEYDRLHHTLTLAEGRALRRELSRHQLHAAGGADLDVGLISSPDTTLGTTEAENLGAAIRQDIAVADRSATRRQSVDGGKRRDARVSFATIQEVIDSSGSARVGEARTSPSLSTKEKKFIAGADPVSTTLNAMSGKELAAELKRVRSNKDEDKVAQIARNSSGESQRLSFDVTGSSNVLEGAEEKTRRAIKLLRTQTDALLFLADAVEAKELPGLAERMRERLNTIKESYHDILSYEGLRQRKKGALKAARKVDLLRGALHLDQQDTRNIPTHESDKPVQRMRDYRVLGLKMLVVGLVFFLLLLTPFIVTQYEIHEHHTACDSAEPGEVKLDHASLGQLEVNLLLGPCIHNASDYHVSYTIYQEHSGHTYELGRSKRIVTPHWSGASASSHRRKLLGGGGGDVSEHLKADFSTFILRDFESKHGSAWMQFQTDCPDPVAISFTAVDTGVVGVVGVWLGAVLLVGVFGLIMIEIIHRTLVAFIGAAAVLFILALQHRLPPIATILTWMDHGTLALLFGMMVIVALLSRSGVFEYFSVLIVFHSKGSMWRLFLMLMMFDAILSAFLDNVTTMLLLAPVALSLCKALKIDPRPLLISMAIFGNIGGCATLIGDPPNIIIGNALEEHIGFVDFLRVLGPGVLLTMPCIFVYLRWYYKDTLFNKTIDVDIGELQKKYPIRDMNLLIRSGAILAFVVILFFLHPVVHMEPAYVASFGAIAILLTGDHDEFEYALEKVEWDSLLFFAGLFVFTEGIAQLGLLRTIADALSKLVATFPAGQRQIGAMLIVQLVAGFASAFVDNIPFTTTMLPVIVRLSESVEGIAIEALAWSLCFGADFGGIGTLIGSSANIVIAGISAEAGFPITFNAFFRIGFPVMCLSLCLSGAYLAALEGAGMFTANAK